MNIVTVIKQQESPVLERVAQAKSSLAPWEAIEIKLSKNFLLQQIQYSRKKRPSQSCACIILCSSHHIALFDTRLAE